MLDLRRADAKSQGSERSMCGCVTIATDDRRAWQGKPLLRADNVYDALALVAETEISDAEILDIVFEGHALEAGVFFLDEGFDVLERLSGGGGDVLLPLLAVVMV
jgi:hypothetical protein